MADKKTLSPEEKKLAAEKHVDELVQKALVALEEMRKLNQEQVDYIVAKASVAALDAHGELALHAYEETGRGVFDDKATKNLFACEHVVNNMRHTKTVGVISEDDVTGLTLIAEPVGVVCGITPTTNPTSTAIFKALISLKTRNPIVFAFHPSAQESSAHAARIVRDAAIAAGAPENCVQWITQPSMEATSALMNHEGVATILATGGNAMVKAAYSCGKPALGVGAGNVPAYVEKSANIRQAAHDIVMSKSFDNGMVCASEQAVIIDKEIYDEFVAEFKSYHTYFVNKKEKALLEEFCFGVKANSKNCAGAKLNADIVGKPATWIAEQAGFTVPEGTNILAAECKEVGEKEPLTREKLSPVIAVLKSESREDGINKARQMVEFNGLGHSAAIHTADEELTKEFGKAVKAIRVICNSPSTFGGIGDVYNAFLPSLTLGCGSYGRNSVGDNVSAINLLNIKKVGRRRNNMQWMKLPSKTYFERDSIEYLQKCRDVERVMIVTDHAMVELGFLDRIIEQLDLRRNKVVYQIFADVEPDPDITTVERGTEIMRAFKPDTIIALGGGSPMDAAKVMWLFYEQPEVDFRDLVQKFMDIRKRAFKFPELGERAKYVGIPTTSGTGSEVQMGQAEGKSMLYLEIRCLYITKGAGVQGIQNGSVSCIGIPAAVPSGIRAVLAENLVAAMLDLECASSNDQTFSHSDLRRTARTLMQFAPGTDFICSGYSSTPNYDNMFAGSNWDAEDYDDWTVIQRDLKVNGGLIPAREEEVVAVRNKAARALQALFKALGLPPITDVKR